MIFQLGIFEKRVGVTSGLSEDTFAPFPENLLKIPGSIFPRVGNLEKFLGRAVVKVFVVDINTKCCYPRCEHLPKGLQTWLSSCSIAELSRVDFSTTPLTYASITFWSKTHDAYRQNSFQLSEIWDYSRIWSSKAVGAPNLESTCTTFDLPNKLGNLPT